MRLRMVLALLPVFFLLGAWNLSAEDELSVASFNIRYGTAKDGLNRWDRRQELVVKTIRQMDADLIGMQEAMHFQLLFLDRQLPGYSRIGIGREGGNEGEFSPIFYRNERLELLDQGTFWFSPTPDRVSKGWGADWERISTWGRFLDRRSGKEFVVYNNHWDHISELSRRNSADLLYERASVHEIPVVLIGDFNTSPESAEIKRLNPAGEESRFVDACKLPAAGSLEAPGTFHRFRGRPRSARIDLILHNDGFRAELYETVTYHEKKRYPSDHFPVKAVLSWNP